MIFSLLVKEEASSAIGHRNRSLRVTSASWAGGYTKKFADSDPLALWIPLVFSEGLPTRDEAHMSDCGNTRRHRFCVVLRGDQKETASAAQTILGAIPTDFVLWIGSESADHRSIAPSEVRKRLGQAFDAVVLDLHQGLDADVLGQCAGMVWGGGRLILRMPHEGTIPREHLDGLAVYPYHPGDVGTRMWERLEHSLAATDATAPAVLIAPASHLVHAEDQQAAVVARLCDAMVDDTPSLWALTADRGRGKSSALGLALREAIGKRPIRVAVCAANPQGAAEIFRFALGFPTPPANGPIRYVTPRDLVQDPKEWDVIVIDEAAQLPVPLLMAMTRKHRRARIAFSTTARGYEGTGRGFVLRFLAWAQSEGRPLVQLSLSQPIRWEVGDPLESFVDSVLALDAEPADLSGLAVQADLPLHVQHVVLDRDDLAHRESLLRDFFGLLVHAHYRTTPADLVRILDAPNLLLHALLFQGRVVAASVVAREGGLPIARCERLARGEGRIRGHALADTLISHAGYTESGTLSMIRSVRIAVHPALRRRKLAALLVDHIHRTHRDVDLFGTLFGATADLISFRRSLGYELVRLGASFGSRTGEPAAVMLRPVSDHAHRLLTKLRLDLARNLPLQLELLRSDGEACLCDDVVQSAKQGLPIPTPLDASERDDLVRRYLFGPQPLDAVVLAVSDFVKSHRESLLALSPEQKALIESRVLQCHGWERCATEAKLPSVPAAMRALRPALRIFFSHSQSLCETRGGAV